MSINYVKFQRGSLDAYIALKDAGRLDKNTLYFIKTEGGVGRLYMGESLISGGDVVLQSAKLDDLEDVIASGANTNSFLVFNGEKWVAKTLSEVAELVVGDIEPVKFNENQFIMDDAGLVNLLGYAEAEIGSQPVKNADGTIGWVKPAEISTEGLATVEQLNNLQELVEGNAKDIDDLQAANNNFNEIIDGKADANEVSEALNLKANIADVNSALEGKANVSDLEGKANVSDLEGKANVSDVNTALELKANAADVYSKTATDKAIADAITAAPHLERRVYETLSDAEVAVATFGDSADKYIYMVARENSSDGNYYDEYMAFKDSNELWQLEKVGDWGVDLSAYAKTADVNTALENKVDKVEGSRLITDVEIGKLEGIEAGAQVNYISTVDQNTFNVEEGKLNLIQISVSKVTNLETLLNNKVDKQEGYRLISPEEATKLEGLSIDDDGSIGISANVNASKVQELYNTVVNIVTGKGTGIYDKVEKPLLGIEPGAEVNYVKSVSEEFEVTNGILNLVNINASKVTNLQELLNEKVSKTDFESLENKVSDIEALLTWQEMN